ncbi:hypothetical protein [Anaerotignum sp.]|uniref:hypothetical protein n=1 Tax=Anaerotignum sp. TaxID=2039241 RepID=UPI0028B1545C|nr:hypothetical protein [Anaerotignum sp.]
MRQEVHEMSVEKRRVIYEKKIREFEMGQIFLTILIIIVGCLAAKQFLLLDISFEEIARAKNVVVCLVAMVTLAGLQLSLRMGQHIFKTTPWMAPFSQGKSENHVINIVETGKIDESEK